MSDAEDDFMCEEEEDYGLVIVLNIFINKMQENCSIPLLIMCVWLQFISTGLPKNI